MKRGYHGDESAECMNTGGFEVTRKMRVIIRSRKTKKNLKHAPGSCKGGRFCAMIHFIYIHSCFSSQGAGVFTLPYVCLLITSQTI